MLPPRPLQDVDRDEVASTALRLFASIAATAPTDERARDSMWQPAMAPPPQQQELIDPLGMGKIDPANMRLVGWCRGWAWCAVLQLAVDSCAMRCARAVASVAWHLEGTAVVSPCATNGAG
jgi:hypothetical protein